jgi:hypothetical protein
MGDEPMYHATVRSGRRIAGKAVRAFGGLLDFQPKLVECSKSRKLGGTKHPSVNDALRSDWERLGGDMNSAMGSVRRELTGAKEK